MSGPHDLNPNSGPAGDYPRRNLSGDALQKTAAGMKLVNGAAAIWVFLSCTCPVLSLVGQASTRKTHSNQIMGPEFILGQITAMAVMTNTIPIVLLFFGLRNVGEALGWKRATVFLIPLGILVTSCICGGVFFLCGSYCCGESAIGTARRTKLVYIEHQKVDRLREFVNLKHIFPK